MESMEEKVLFVVGSPRSGSTMLARMIQSHSKVYGRPEPHMMTPLAHLGFYENIEKAPYDHILAAESMRDFVSDLPHGEQDYVDACRAYTDTLYGRMLETQAGKVYFMDKTPANSLVLDFISRIYPNAKYVVLTRHPLAVFSSFAESFFDSDYQAAYDYNPLVERYVPALAKFLRSGKAPIHQVIYEQLVQDPETILAGVFEFLGLENEPEAVDYGKHKHEEKGLGDPIGVAKHSRPSTASMHKWAAEVAAVPSRRKLCEKMIAKVDPEDLKLWGHPIETIWKPLEEQDPNGKAPKKKKLDRYRIERKLIVKGRSMAKKNGLVRKVLETMKLGADVLLRD